MRDLFFYGVIFGALFVLAASQLVHAMIDENIAHNNYYQTVLPQREVCHAETEDSVITDCDYDGNLNAWVKK